MRSYSRLAAAVVLAFTAAPAFAESESSWSTYGGMWAVSDYVWRGVSQTQEDPTWQVEVGAEHESGFYAGAFLSGVDFTPAGADYRDGISYEVNAYLGWNQDLNDVLNLDVSLTHIAYPGAKEDFDADFNELSVALGFAENYTATVTYSDNTVNLGSKGFYYQLAGEWGIGESDYVWGASAGLYRLGSSLGGSYKDYEVYVAREFQNIAMKLSYHDTASYSDFLAESLGERHLADGRFVLSIGYQF